MNTPNQPLTYVRYQSGEIQATAGEIIVETPVTLTVNGDPWLTFMCTPVDLEALAVGFLYNEGQIKTVEEIASVRVCASGDNIDVWLAHRAHRPEKWRRTSGCSGGLTSVDESESRHPITNGGTLVANQVGKLIDQLFASQQLYRASGGVHTSALSDGEQLQIIAEDIGRHNTLDKLAGRYLMEKPDISRKVIVTTGRISSEMLQKTARLGASIIISRTSPSSLSIEHAQKWGITLIGYARRNRFNLYSHPQRIVNTLEMVNSP